MKKTGIEILGYYKRMKDSSEFIMFRNNGKLYLTNGIFIWNDQFHRIENKYLLQMEKVQQINLMKIHENMLHYFPYSEITKIVGNLLTNLIHFAIIFMSSERRKSRMIQTTLRLPEKLYSGLKKQAKRKGLSWNAYVISILWEVLEK